MRRILCLTMIAVLWGAATGAVQGAPPKKTTQPPPAAPSDPNLDPSKYVWYGFAMPEDERFRYTYQDNSQRDLLALVAQGNIVIGDYTSTNFQTQVVPLIRSGASAITQPYVIDPADAVLGYHDAGFDEEGNPKFSGDYGQIDAGGTGVKLGGASRRFYESTLSDAAFRALVDPMDDLYSGQQAVVDAVLYTNHVLAGLIGSQQVAFYGSLVARDDVLLSSQRMVINHDVRLIEGSTDDLALPMSLGSPLLVDWIECAPGACD